jgi:hypothetical protein
VTIRFPTRSQFFDPLRLGIKLARSRMDQGRPIEVQLEPGGYRGKWVVIITPENHEEFEAIGSMRDPTRFPQRIKVAAWALHQEKAFGRFVIEHDRDSGTVTITRDD